MRKKLQILFIISFFIMYTKAQDGPIENFSLIKKINSSVALNEGRVDVSIPLFSIPVGNLELSNRIYNNANGFNNFDDESIFGINWNGALFGQITRIPRRDLLMKGGRRAEERDFYTQDCINETSNLSRTYTKKKLLLDPLNNGLSTKKTDFNPDIFYFDFFGYKGYFIFDNWGQNTPEVVSETGNLKVFFTSSGINGCPSAMNNVDTSNYFTILDDKGNTFYFGGSYDSVDINYEQFVRSGSFARASRGNYIISWNLKKVILSNGETIVGNYKPGNRNVLNNYLTNPLPESGGFGSEFPSDNELIQANLYFSKTHSITDPFAVYYIDSYIFTKRAILESITVENNPNIKIEYDYFRSINGVLPHLNQIRIVNYNKSKIISFNQKKYGTGLRYFLESLNIGDEKYEFDYYYKDTLPNKFFENNKYLINEFGYWTGGLPGDQLDQLKYDASLLKKIIYPTKGYELYDYERGDHSKSYVYSSYDRDYRFEDDNYFGLKRQIARVSLKTTFDNKSVTRIRYEYKLDNEKSSGIVENDQFNLFSTNSFYKINYSKVREIVDGKGYTDYYFSDRITNPDGLNQVKVFGPIGGQYQSGSDYKKYTIPRNSERGKLLRKKIYDNSNNLILEHVYDYENFLHPESELVDISSVNCTNCRIFDLNYFVFTEAYPNPYKGSDYPPIGVLTMYVPLLPYLLKSEKIIDYRGSQSLESETKIKYLDSNINWHTSPIEKNIITPTGTSTFKYIYPRDLDPKSPCQRGCYNPLDYDKVGEQFKSYRYMLKSNIVTPVIEIDKNDKNKYSLTENLFYTFPFINKTIRNSRLTANFDENNYNLLKDDMVDKINFDKYDNRSNYIQTTTSLGVPTTTIWGYNQTQPIAKIEGANYEQVMQAFQLDGNNFNSYLQLDIVQKSNIDIDETSENDLLTALEAFRKNSTMSGYQITTYTYDPLIGVRSITPPSGIREVYIYDTANRLKEVRDITGNILKSYEYHYKP
ncbi:hypothetical protein [Epilithonimonas vandammei]|uniref:RHS repeat protein n=1 Tax=Epilithonimonas vandammei TaxID=2487072 RepID=A0A3G8Y8C3_9FLAO|nr:hypothetical protein [Epilithonimonas vandammei]AZI41163.1 hypothetical protein EIB74_14915 [Epilithonimonas vandammei]